ncbi:MAG: IS200/IS605 family element transposase accessory protein TnpB [Moorea sp. SIO1F2]|uniref:transposase n=1 Tax=unclassified Moorena TaxID=2683338 RepID=UPI0013BE0AD7|nr:MULTISPECIES: transposase [unclassified Moorena]NEO21496.1 IS200/IS605 family element transposase accessory protein TnpB [Moorena sp. SIO4A5]NEQ59126.1 IS200/IS605 family element transposase accessory protein TnpB [Moorena sp. SIO4A1]NET84958.1 IS200/IS605 family element transposase accessory protein TnpB [Moorena sp. SIO1F2]
MAQKKRRKDLIRTDKWQLKPSQLQRQLLRLTVQEFRSICRGLISVVFTHWPELGGLSSKQRIPAVERLMHKTRQNQYPKYEYFIRRFYKFPSYYRRSAISFAIGQVSSFVTRYMEWQSGIRKRRDAKPPRLNADCGCYPALYQGQCILFGAAMDTAKIKVFTGTDWVWTLVPVEIEPGYKRHLLDTNEKLSPYLIVNEKKCHLSVPFRCNPDDRQETNRVVSVDLGINTTAVASVVTSDGTVLARRFIHPGRDIDRRDKRLKGISKKASLSNGKLHKGFCRGNYRKASNINTQIAHSVSRELVDFAEAWGAKFIVFELLLGWKPRGGRKRSNLRQRFHGWLHRAIATWTEAKWNELGGTVKYVNPRGTSSNAYDGSGSVKRDSKNYGLCTFPTGKRYNTDLQATYNIAAKYWFYELVHKKGEAKRGKRTRLAPRSRAVTLSTLWNTPSSSVVGFDTPSYP